MSAVPAASAAVRLPRSAGARRVLLTVTFLGGLLALGFLFGGSAQAASASALPEGDAAVPSTALVDADPAERTTEAAEQDGTTGPGQVVRAEQAEMQDEFAEHRQDSSRSSSEAVGQVTEPVAENTENTQRFTRPVGDAVDGVTGGAQLDDVTDRVVPGGDERADNTRRQQDAPAGQHAQQGRAVGDEPASGHASGTTGQDASAASLPVRALPDAVPAAGQAVAHDDTQGGAGGSLPGRHLPFGNPPCVPGSAAPSAQNAGEGKGGSRGGADQLAAYLTDGERCALPRPGAVQAADGTPTRDRAAEILEFPG